MSQENKIEFCEESSSIFGIYAGKKWNDYTEQEIDDLYTFYTHLWEM